MTIHGANYQPWQERADRLLQPLRKVAAKSKEIAESAEKVPVKGARRKPAAKKER